MLVTQVTLSDGKAVAHILSLLNTGRWEVTGAEMDQTNQTKRWLHDISLQMASQLRGVPGVVDSTPTSPVVASTPPVVTPPAAVGGLRIKSRGTLGSGATKGKRGRK